MKRVLFLGLALALGLSEATAAPIPLTGVRTREEPAEVTEARLLLAHFGEAERFRRRTHTLAMTAASTEQLLEIARGALAPGWEGDADALLLRFELEQQQGAGFAGLALPGWIGPAEEGAAVILNSPTPNGMRGQTGLEIPAPVAGRPPLLDADLGAWRLVQPDRPLEFPRSRPGAPPTTGWMELDGERHEPGSEDFAAATGAVIRGLSAPTLEAATLPQVEPRPRLPLARVDPVPARCVAGLPTRRAATSACEVALPTRQILLAAPLSLTDERGLRGSILGIAGRYTRLMMSPAEAALWLGQPLPELLAALESGALPFFWDGARARLYLGHLERWRQQPEGGPDGNARDWNRMRSELTVWLAQATAGPASLGGLEPLQQRLAREGFVPARLASGPTGLELRYYDEDARDWIGRFVQLPGAPAPTGGSPVAEELRLGALQTRPIEASRDGDAGRNGRSERSDRPRPDRSERTERPPSEPRPAPIAPAIRAEGLALAGRREGPERTAFLPGEEVMMTVAIRVEAEEPVPLRLALVTSRDGQPIPELSAERTLEARPGGGRLRVAVQVPEEWEGARLGPYLAQLVVESEGAQLAGRQLELTIARPIELRAARLNRPATAPGGLFTATLETLVAGEPGAAPQAFAITWELLGGNLRSGGSTTWEQAAGTDDVALDVTVPAGFPSGPARLLLAASDARGTHRSTLEVDLQIEPAAGVTGGYSVDPVLLDGIVFTTDEQSAALRARARAEGRGWVEVHGAAASWLGLWQQLQQEQLEAGVPPWLWVIHPRSSETPRIELHRAVEGTEQLVMRRSFPVADEERAALVAALKRVLAGYVPSRRDVVPLGESR